MLQPEAEQAHRGKKVSRNGTLSDVPSNRVAEARGVLSHSSELAEAVMRGEKPLQTALQEARMMAEIYFGKIFGTFCGLGDVRTGERTGVGRS